MKLACTSDWQPVRLSENLLVKKDKQLAEAIKRNAMRRNIAEG